MSGVLSVTSMSAVLAWTTSQRRVQPAGFGGLVTTFTDFQYGQQPGQFLGSMTAATADMSRSGSSYGESSCAQNSSLKARIFPLAGGCSRASASVTKP